MEQSTQRRLLLLPCLLLAGLGVVYGASTRFETSATEQDRGEGLRGLPAVDAATPAERGQADARELEPVAAAPDDVEDDPRFPLHGLVEAPQLIVRAAPDPGALVIGWLRLGARVRLGAEVVRTPTCATGWYAVRPRGHVCAGQGVAVGEAPPTAEVEEAAADTGSALPYRYLRARQPQVPEYHRLPSRETQRAAAAHGARYAELLNAGQERRAEALRAGRLSGEPPKPAGVARFLQRNFFVAGTGVEVRGGRRFVRTVRGSYLQEAQLLETRGSEYRGVELGPGADGEPGRSLPVAFAVRASRPMRQTVRSDGTPRFVDDESLEVYERQDVLPWLRRERIGARTVHVIEGPDEQERYLLAWFAGVAEAVARPRGVREDEPWVHVDVSEQTLVLYRGDTPTYATLVSSGLEGHDTPRGLFTIRRKFVSDTMANLGPDAGDDSYRIEDVPWTQYFDGSVALHGAFWHHRFGLRRSHGCVNLAPRDARRVFEHTWPAIPHGWHGVSTEGRTGFTGSRVLVTD